MNDAILSVKNLSVNYRKVEAVHKVAIDVQPGKIVTVIGPNGAGKSTLLGAIMGSLPHYGGVTGEIIYAGASIRQRAVEERVAAGMCLVPEKRELFSTMSVE